MSTEAALIICAASALFLLFGAPLSHASEIEIVNIDTISDLIESNKNLQILDVRTPEEFASGHIPHAINLNVGNPEFADQISSLEQDIPILVYCRSGVRAKSAASILTSNGFSQIYLMQGGMEDWIRANYPVESSEETLPHKTETSFFRSIINNIYSKE